MPRRAVVVLAALMVAASGCGAERIESAIDAPLPDYIEPCEEQYEEGKIIQYGSEEEDDFSRACRQHEELVTPVPVRLDCADGADLLYNEFAWGFDGEEMTLFEPDEVDRRPDEEVRMACLRRDIDSIDGEAEGEAES